MCGIFGAVGSKINPKVVLKLALHNRARGQDSIGFFDSHGEVTKDAEDPFNWLVERENLEWIWNSCRNSWFVCGHTRAATQGAVIKRNAHPFRYGNIIGSHNGIVYPPNDYEVDSQYLIDRLSQEESIQEALAPVSGWWGLEWAKYNSAETTLYLSAFGNSIHVFETENAWYWSSAEEPIKCIFGESSTYHLSLGDTVAWYDTEVMVELEPAMGKEPNRLAYRSACTSTLYDDEDRTYTVWDAKTGKWVEKSWNDMILMEDEEDFIASTKYQNRLLK